MSQVMVTCDLPIIARNETYHSNDFFIFDYIFHYAL